MNEYKEGRRVLKGQVVAGIRDAFKEAAGELPASKQIDMLTAEEEAAKACLPVDGISVRTDPSDRTAWLVTVSIPRHTLTDDEAMFLANLSD